MTTTVSGASDDLIEVEGDISEEFSYQDDALLVTATGVVLSFDYGRFDPVWQITVLAGHDKVSVKPCNYSADEDDSYSDVATLLEDPAFVVYGGQIARAKR